MKPFSLVSAFYAALLTLANVTAQDDRENPNPTAHGLEAGVDAATIASRIQNGNRLIDIEVLPGTPTRYVTASVRNTGSYARQWWWQPSLTEAALDSFAQSNSARPIDIEPIVQGNSVTFASIMVENTGAQAKNWWWVAMRSARQIIPLSQTLNARPVDVESYVLNGVRHYAAIFVENTGADTRSWRFLNDTSASDITDTAAQNGLRVYSLEALTDTTFDAILTSPENDKPTWHYFGRTLSQVTELVRQNGARAVDLERYSTPAGFRFAAVLKNNVNDLTTRVGGILRDGYPSGFKGAYLKQLGGPVLAGLMQGWRHEPADALAEFHLYGMCRALDAGTFTTGTPITYYDGCGSTCCPSATNPRTQAVFLTLQGMMRGTNRQAAFSIASALGGLPQIEAAAALAGATNTTINSQLGCVSPPNESTLVDIARVHEAVAAGGSNGVGRFAELFYEWHDFETLVNRTPLGMVTEQEAQSIGLSTELLQEFQGLARFWIKSGAYQLPGPTFTRSASGVLRIPFRRRGGYEMVRYASGVFLDRFAGPTDPGSTVLDTAHAELHRELIREALLSFRDHNYGQLTEIGAACSTSAGPLTARVAGFFDIGSRLTLIADVVPSGAPSFFFLGATRRVQPIPLVFLGAPGCNVYVDWEVPLAGQPPVFGNGTFAAVDIPDLPQLIGGSLFTQAVVLDASANRLGLATSQGFELVVGG